MAKAVLEFFLKNGEVKRTEDFSDLYRSLDPAVYEVIRILHGRPLFPKEHYERLIGSLATIGETLPISYETFCDEVGILAEANAVTEYNCRFVINDFGSEEGPQRYLFMIPTHYPSEEEYEKGVAVDLLKAVRKDPQAKIWNASLREAADDMIRKKDLFEVLLVDDQDRITEGSRSNVFFIRGDTVYTTPSEAVLLGITRQKILEACEGAGIPAKEVFTKADETGSYEAGFVSGTSPKVLPIRRIGEVAFDPDNALLKRIMALYDEMSEASAAR